MLAKEYASVLRNAQNSGDQQKAADNLQSLATKLDTLLYQSLRCDIVDDEAQLQPVKDKLADGATLRSEIIDLSRNIQEKNPAGHPLRLADQRVRNTVHAIEQHLTYSLLELSSSSRTAEQICASSIAIKRRIVAEMRAISANSDMSKAANRLQGLADELNKLAEEQAASGRRISVMAFEHEGANRATDETRAWLANHITENLSPNAELRYTLDEVQSVVRRMDMAFRSSIAKLDTLAGQRVAERLNAGGNSTAAESLLAQNQASPASTPPKKSVGSMLPKYTRPAIPTAAPAASQPAADVAVARPNSPENCPSSQVNSVANGRNTHLSPSLDSQMSSSDSPAYDNHNHPPGRYSGPTALQVKIVNVGSLAVSEETSRFGQRIGAHQSDSTTNGQHATMSFLYSGSLHSAARAVNFGEVEICDTQSRTLFVRAGNTR